MWIKKDKASPELWKYIIDEDTICFIKKIEVTDDRTIWSELYKGGVYIKDELMSDQLKLRYSSELEGLGIAYKVLYDEDFDILKLKCLIRAKEMGWNIKEIKI